MRLDETTYDARETGCCARVDRARWEGREHVWHEKPFLRDHLRAFLHVPLNFGSVISRDQATIEAAQAWPAEPIWLTEEVSPWGSELFVAVDRDVPGARIERLSGRLYSRVFEGPYRHAGRWATEMERWVEGRGERIERLYFFYATCPECAKKLGSNQTVLFARVEGRGAPAA